MISTSDTIQIPPAVTAVESQAPYVRPADAADTAALSAVERAAFPSQWPPTRFSKEVNRRRTSYLVAARELPVPLNESNSSHRSRRSEQRRGILGKITDGLKQISFMTTVQPRDYVTGFVGIWFIADEAHIVSLGVRPSDQRKGVGELLLLATFREARSYGMKEVTLEVRASNAPAQALYRKYGFRDIGLRKRYYIDNGEDAIIMTTPPIANANYAGSIDSLARSHAVRWGHAVQPAS